MMAMHIMHVNINSLRAKRTEVEQYLREQSPDIACFNETKLAGKAPPRLSGYKCVCARDRQNGGGGGVAIYVKMGLHCSDISPDVDDLVAIELTVGTNKLAVLSYYCPPATGGGGLDVRLLERYVATYDRLVLTGDLNAKHLFSVARALTPEATFCSIW